MDPVSLLKALLIHAAYEGACAVCEPLISNPDGKQVAIDPLIQDVPLQQKGLLVYEEAKVQYAAILRVHGRSGRALLDLDAGCLIGVVSVSQRARLGFCGL
jgi:hypothetical protein